MSLERDRSKNSAFMSKVSIVSAVPFSQACGFISFASFRIQMIYQQMHQLSCFSFQTSFINITSTIKSLVDHDVTVCRYYL